MTTSEARRLLRKSGWYVLRVMSGHSVEIWSNGTEEFRIGTASTMAPAEISKIRTLIRRHEKSSAKPRTLKVHEAVVGARVRSLRDFVGVPAGTTAVIDEDYGTGIMVKWDLTNTFKPLRDGFDKRSELEFLEPL